jgi:hypothetical protein
MAVEKRPKLTGDELHLHSRRSRLNLMTDAHRMEDGRHRVDCQMSIGNRCSPDYRWNFPLCMYIPE